MSNYAILRTAKLKTNGNIGGASAHNTRTMDVPGIAADRTHLNKVLGTKNAVKGVQDRIDAIYKDSEKGPRKNAVRAVETLLTASPEFFDQLAPRWRDGQLGKINDWFKENLRFIRDMWGRDNIIQVALHLDEKTPHIQAITVPEVDGKLNCRAILGDRGKLRQLQDDYASRMAQFGLERGVKNSNAHHIPIGDYHGSQQQILDSLPKPERMLQFVGEKKGVFRSSVETKTRNVIPWNQQNKQAIEALASMANATFINEEMARRARERLDEADNEFETREALTRRLDDLQNELKGLREKYGKASNENDELRRQNKKLQEQALQLQERLEKYEPKPKPKPAQEQAQTDLGSRLRQFRNDKDRDRNNELEI